MDLYDTLQVIYIDDSLDASTLSIHHLQLYHRIQLAERKSMS